MPATLTGLNSPYLGPEGANAARNQSRNDQNKMYSSLEASGTGQTRAIMSDMMKQGNQFFNPSQFMNQAQGNMYDIQGAIDRAAIDSEQVYQNSLERAKREAARRGKSLSAADIRKAAIAGASGKVGAMNTASAKGNDLRFQQAIGLAQLDDRRRALGMNALGQAGNLARFNSNQELNRANAYGALSAEGAQYYGMANNRSDTGLPDSFRKPSDSKRALTNSWSSSGSEYSKQPTIEQKFNQSLDKGFLTKPGGYNTTPDGKRAIGNPASGVGRLPDDYNDITTNPRFDREYAQLEPDSPRRAAFSPYSNSDEFYDLDNGLDALLS